MATQAEQQDPPIPAVVRRYMKRQRLGVMELSRRVGRSHASVSNLLSSDAHGLKPWQGESLLFMIARALEIPERELSRAIAAHYRWLAEQAEVELPGSSSGRRAQKGCYLHPPGDVPERVRAELALRSYHALARKAV
jgi:transcriptional regulator with XRE-family HTH domain